MTDPVVSIILPTKNGGAEFRRCLSAVFDQAGAPSFEVIVIDSGSSDDTLDIARSFPVTLHQISPAEFGHARTRNLGASMARGRYLIYLTQDAVPANDHWLHSLVRNLEENDRVAGAYSRWLAKPDADPLEAGWIWYTFGAVKETRSLEGLSEADRRTYNARLVLFSDVSSTIRRAVWERIPFDEKLAFAEDQGWAKGALEAGHTIIYEPQSIVYHSHRYSIGEYFKKSFDMGRSLRTFSNGGPGLLMLLAGIPLQWVYLRKSGFAASPWRVAHASTARAFGAAGHFLGSHHRLLPKALKRRMSTVPHDL